MERLELNETSRVLVLTGAGVSAESGVPTFRGANGLWEGHRIEEVASPEGFADDPTLVWKFYGLRREGALKVHPNPGHLAIAKLEERIGNRFFLATQNVDGLHARAGSQRMVAIHGELFKSRCLSCQVPFEDTKSHLGEPLPRCPKCDQLIRPHIVWFGEMLDPDHLQQIGSFIAKAGSKLHFFAVGTSGQVYPAAGIVDEVRHRGGTAWLVDVDPSPEYAVRFQHVIRGKSGEVLPELFGTG